MRKSWAVVAAIAVVLVMAVPAAATHESISYDPPPENGTVSYDAPAVEVPFTVDPAPVCVNPPAETVAVAGDQVTVDPPERCVDPAPVNGTTTYDAASVSVPYTHDPPPRDVPIPDEEEPPPDPPADPTYTSSIADGATVEAGTTWTVVPSPVPTSVELWATNTKLKTDTDAPYDVVLDLAPGTYVLGVCSWYEAERTCFSDRKSITITDSAPPPPTGEELWSADFEDGTLGGFSIEAKDPSRVQIVTSPARHGSRSVRLEVLPTDTNVFNSGGFVRTGLNHATFPFAGHEGQDNWYAWSVYYPSATPHTRGGMVDWHTSASVTEPDGSGAGDTLGNWPEGLSLDVYGQCCAPDGAHPGTSHWGDHWIAQPMQLDHWYDIVFHIKWSVDPGVGFYEVFVDKTRRVNFRQASTLFVNYPTTRMKMQIYRPPTGISVAERVYYDNPRVATSWSAAVADFGGWPSSPPS